MSTLEIRKLQSGAFKHVDSIDGEFFLGRFNYKNEFGKAFLVEAYGAKRRSYIISEISVFDYLGTEETFTNFTDLENRLTELGYTGIDINPVYPTAASYISSDVDNTLELGTDNKLFVPPSAGDFLSDDATTYASATLPLTGTEVAILNDGTNWVKITWNNIKAQLGNLIQSVSGDSVDNTDPLNPIINAIPLSGTTVGSPITGDIEMSDGIKLFINDGSIRIGGVANGIEIPNDGPSNNAIISFPDTSKGLSGGRDYTPNITDFDYTQKKYVDNLVNTATNTATVTVELVNSLFTDFYAPDDLRINTTNTIFGVGTITLKVNDVAYTLTDLIIKGDKITVETNSESVFNLNIIYE